MKSVMNPGVISSMPAIIRKAPSSTSATGGRPCSTACVGSAQRAAALARQDEGAQNPRTHHHGERRPETDHLPGLDEQGQLRERQCDENKAET